MQHGLPAHAPRDDGRSPLKIHRSFTHRRQNPPRRPAGLASSKRQQGCAQSKGGCNPRLARSCWDARTWTACSPAAAIRSGSPAAGGKTPDFTPRRRISIHRPSTHRRQNPPRQPAGLRAVQSGFSTVKDFREQPRPTGSPHRPNPLHSGFFPNSSRAPQMSGPPASRGSSSSSSSAKETKCAFGQR